MSDSTEVLHTSQTPPTALKNGGNSNGHANGHTTFNRSQPIAGPVITVEELAQRFDFKRISGEWHGANPTGEGATKDGFILNDDGTAHDRKLNKRYKSIETAQAFGIDPGEFEPVATYRARNGHNLNGHATKAPATAQAPKPKPVRETVRDYHGADGKVLFQTIRREFADGSKDFLQRQPDGKGGWTWNLKGIEPVLFNLPDVLAAQTVFVVEGEKCADQLNDELIRAKLHGPTVATTNAGGAGKWRDSYSEALVGKYVVFLPDNDEPGEKHAAKACPSIAEHAGALKVLRLPDLPPKGDIIDFFEAGGTLAKVLLLAEAALDWSPSVTTGQAPAPSTQFDFSTDELLDDKLSEIHWEWPGYIPRGFVTLLVADQDQGKSTVAQDLCRTRLIGGRWPDGTQCNEQAEKLLWIDTEGALALFRQRLRDWKMPRGRFILPPDPLQELAVDNAADWAWIEAAIERFKPPIVVLDSLSGGHRGEENNNDQMKMVLKKMGELAQRYQIAVIVVHHLSKPAAGVPDYPLTLNRIRGASAITQFCRSVLALTAPDKNQPDLRRLDVIKLNLAKKPPAVGYTLTDTGPAWGDAPQPAQPRRAADDAEDWLNEAMSSGVRPSDEVWNEARAAGIGEKALKKAKARLGVISKREGGKEGKWFLVRDKGRDDA